MKKIYIISIILFAINIFATNNWVDGLTNQGWFVSACINSTNFIVKYPTSHLKLMASYDRWDTEIKSTCYSPRNGEEFLITTNRITKIADGYLEVSYTFTPVSFTNQMIGFRIDHQYATKWDFNISSGAVERTNQVYYVALSDTPVEVGEADVENPNIAKMEDEED